MLYLGSSFLSISLKPYFFLPCTCIYNFHPQFALPVTWSAISERSSDTRSSHLFTFELHITSSSISSGGGLGCVFVLQVLNKLVCCDTRVCKQHITISQYYIFNHINLQQYDTALLATLIGADELWTYLIVSSSSLKRQKDEQANRHNTNRNKLFLLLSTTLKLFFSCHHARRFQASVLHSPSHLKNTATNF